MPIYGGNFGRGISGYAQGCNDIRKQLILVSGLTFFGPLAECVVKSIVASQPYHLSIKLA